jgi:DNA-binding MarR family transcriptional regulator
MRTEEVFMKFFLSFHDKITDPKSTLRFQDVKVFLTLCRNANWQNQVFKKQATLAEKLHLKSTQVTASIKKLAELKMIEKKRDRDFGLYYELNKEFVEKGNSKENKNVVVRKRKVASSKIVPLKRVK